MCFMLTEYSIYGNLCVLKRPRSFLKKDNKMSLHNASKALRELALLDRKRAETLFVLAILSARHGYSLVARGYAEECIALLGRLGTESYEDCATNFVRLEGVELPELLHEDVVRNRLSAYGVQV